MLAGLVLGALSDSLGWVDLGAIRLTPELLYRLFLPILLFEVALHLNWHEFRQNLRAILILAIPRVAAARGKPAQTSRVMLSLPWVLHG